MVSNYSWHGSPVLTFLSPAPFFDPTTSLYHLFFQWNPYLNDWGNDTLAITWGHATSTNLIDWDFKDEPALSPDQPYDFKGVFTGGIIPSTVHAGNSSGGQNSSSPLVVAYTSVKRGGVTFRQPYPIGTETLSLAESYDQGATWQKYAHNPIVGGAPTPDYTGWRDPYVSYWPAADQLTGEAANASLYALVSGGFRDRGPTTFVYKIDPNNLTSWQYVSPLVDIKSNTREGKWTGDVGKNWECVNRMTLKDPSSSLEREFLIISAEGVNPSQSTNGNTTAAEELMIQRTPRFQLWMTGGLAKGGNNSISFVPSASGIFDSGNLYATNSFRHPITGHLMAWGWSPEEDLPNEIRAEQGWSGIISMPRELYLQVHHNVSGYLGGKNLSSIPVFEALHDVTGNSTYGTMGIKLPHDVLKGLQARASSQEHVQSWQPLNSSGTGGKYHHDIALNDTAHVIIQTSIRYPSANSTATVGITIVHDAVQNLHTTISFNPINQTITIDRSNTVSSNASSIEKTVNRRPESASHTLLTYASGSSKTMETLDLVVLVDKSMLEVYVNERTIITSRLYVNGSSSVGAVSMFAEGEGATGVVFQRAGVWSGVDAEMRY